jgi:cytochrome c oxidase subunit 2
MLFKRDVIPGVDNRFEVTIETEGDWVGRCAELCGTYHSMMNFEVRGVSPENYERYLALRKEGRSTPEALAGIGEPAFATTTEPFNTERKRTAS